jgi:uncharacterized membrane protein YqhA
VLKFGLSLRYVMLLASCGASVGAVLMFWEGFLNVRDAIVSSWSHDSPGPAVITSVMEATDKFLFGIVLVIFAFAITFGFVLNLSEQARNNLPGWMRLSGIDELKNVFLEVIIVYLAVDYVTDIAEKESHSDWSIVALPLGIFLLAGAMRLLADVRAKHTQTH